MEMSNIFQHVSPSHLNDFIERRPIWYIRRVLGRDTSPMPPRVHGGTAMEMGIVDFLTTPHDPSLQAAVNNAEKHFDNLCEGLDPAAVEAERATLPYAIEAGYDAVRELMEVHGPISATQTRVTLRLNDGGLPCMGFIDIQFADGYHTDLKKTAKKPSRISGGHARQVAFYSKATGCPGGLDYVVTTKKGTTAYHMELNPLDVPGRVAELAAAERAIKATLAMAETPMDLVGCMLPDPDHFTLSGHEERLIASELWGLPKPTEGLKI